MKILIDTKYFIKTSLIGILKCLQDYIFFMFKCLRFILIPIYDVKDFRRKKTLKQRIVIPSDASVVFQIDYAKYDAKKKRFY